MVSMHSAIFILPHPASTKRNCKESDDEFNYEVTAVHGNLDFDLLVYPFFGKGAFFHVTQDFFISFPPVS